MHLSKVILENKSHLDHFLGRRRASHGGLQTDFNGEVDEEAAVEEGSGPGLEGAQGARDHPQDAGERLKRFCQDRVVSRQ